MSFTGKRHLTFRSLDGGGLFRSTCLFLAETSTKKNTDMIMNTIIDQGEDAVNILRHLNGVFTKGNWSSFFGGCQDLENKTQAL